MDTVGEHGNPAGVDEQLQQRIQTFYDVIRDWLVAFFFFSALLGCAYFLLSRFRRKKPDDSMGEDEIERMSLAFLLCSVALSFALAAFFLVPGTLWASLLLEIFPDNYYMQWLSKDLVYSAWRIVVFGSHFSLFILAPFAYFYHESDSVSGSRGIAVRLYESAALVLLLLIIVVGFLGVVTAIIWPGDLNWLFQGTWSLSMAKAALNQSVSMILDTVSVLGTCAVLFAVPRGMAWLLQLSISLRVPLASRSRAEERAMALKLEEESIIKLENRTLHPSSNSMIHRKGREWNPDSEIDPPSPGTEIHEMLEKVRAKREKADQELGMHRVWWNILMVILVTTNLVLLWYSTLKCFQSAASSFTSLLWITGTDNNVNISEHDRIWTTAFEAIRAVYMGIAAFAGIYSGLSDVILIRPKLNASSLANMVSNTALSLIIGTSLPSVVQITGYTGFRIPGPVAETTPFKTIEMRRGYAILFLLVIFFFLLRLIRWRKPTTARVSIDNEPRSPAFSSVPSPLSSTMGSPVRFLP